MGKVKVSIAMATYNGERFLRKQLDSLFSQTRRPDEVVVCDDNSSDGTIDILKEYNLKYGLRYYVNSSSLGVNRNFFKAIELCTGDYIAICDQDDIWLPNKIEISLGKLREIENDEPALVSSQCNHIDATDEIILELPTQKDSSSYAENLLGSVNISQGCSLMMNRSLRNAILSKKESCINANGMYDSYIGLVATLIGKKYNIGMRLMLYRHHDKNVLGQIKKLSLKGKLLNQTRFKGFVHDKRLQSISYIYPEFKEKIVDKKVGDLCQHLIKIYYEKSFVKSFLIIFKIKELSLGRKFAIIIKTCFVNILKFII